MESLITKYNNMAIRKEILSQVYYCPHCHKGATVTEWDEEKKKIYEGTLSSPDYALMEECVKGTTKSPGIRYFTCPSCEEITKFAVISGFTKGG